MPALCFMLKMLQNAQNYASIKIRMPKAMQHHQRHREGCSPPKTVSTVQQLWQTDNSETV